jgi:hypothetical protein
MVDGKHFEAGNDVPRSGYEGDYVRLLPVGRRRKLCRDVRAEAVAAALAVKLDAACRARDPGVVAAFWSCPKAKLSD